MPTPKGVHSAPRSGNDASYNRASRGPPKQTPDCRPGKRPSAINPVTMQKPNYTKTIIARYPNVSRISPAISIGIKLLPLKSRPLTSSLENTTGLRRSLLFTTPSAYCGITYTTFTKHHTIIFPSSGRMKECFRWPLQRHHDKRSSEYVSTSLSKARRRLRKMAYARAPAPTIPSVEARSPYSPNASTWVFKHALMPVLG